MQIRVFCRIKPHPRSAVSTTADGLSVRLHAEGKDQAFTFDRVFGPQADQAAVFQEVSELVQSALDGYKVRRKAAPQGDPQPVVHPTTFYYGQASRLRAASSSSLARVDCRGSPLRKGARWFCQVMM